VNFTPWGKALFMLTMGVNTPDWYKIVLRGYFIHLGDKGGNKIGRTTRTIKSSCIHKEERS
jgi:hypothetical protein